ncbi:hypothetical protein G7K_0387-t2 [Saitoella complicata NRRL Y-17804]|uniref:Uncharacterized protein n=1 Tax=Saitoella complicata (strain BCRC 22490 / CBS 7301 / JCM 7358 / NBRC 10748 / NRRL Y-17804) TaxID=698492 RepID=A0A0E9N8J8_SAICN|nr:hypothetical protein G7K_0387-t2 [Saitoella complicata NRRL Y-17804]
MPSSSTPSSPKQTPTTMTQFYIRLQEGICGGIKPATPRLLLEITSPGEGAPSIKSSERKQGTKVFKEQSAEVSAEQINGLASELKEVLAGLPTEKPRGAEDIYGLDTSIFFGSDELEWRNGGPEGFSFPYPLVDVRAKECETGCTPGLYESDIQPTAAQKAKFKDLVEKIKAIASSSLQ